MINIIWNDIVEEKRLEVLFRFDSRFVTLLNEMKILDYQKEIHHRKLWEQIKYEYDRKTFTSIRTRYLKWKEEDGSSYFQELTTWGFIDAQVSFEECLYLRSLFNILSDRINEV